MFVAGQSPLADLVFSFLSFIVAVPSAIKVFNWTTTLYRGQITFEAPMLYAMGFLGLFTLGGMTGLHLASVPLNIHLHATYFVIAHFHFIMVGGTVSAFLGGIHYWWPKIAGRLYPESWARFAAITLFLGFLTTFLPQYVMGYAGMPRRYQVYLPEFQIYHVMSSVGALILAVAYILPLIYLGWSLLHGKRAGDNPWSATGLEWQTSSPPAKENFHGTPHVTNHLICTMRRSSAPIRSGTFRRRGNVHERRHNPARALAECRTPAIRRHLWHLDFSCHRTALLRGAVSHLRRLSQLAPRSVPCGLARDIVYGTTNTVILLTSSLIMTIAERAATDGLRRVTSTCLLLTAALGTAFLVVKGFEYSSDISKGLVPGPEFRCIQLRPNCSGLSTGS
jgi:Cytochrome C and Quinol oxidase polypeptide I